MGSGRVGTVSEQQVLISDVNHSATCLGVGLVSIDVVKTSGDIFAAAGGSCGNVVAILAWFGWDALPVGRIGCDWAGEYVKHDLGSVGVDTALLLEERRVQTPIIFQRFVEERNGRRRHRFSLVCPECGQWLPRYRAITLRQAAEIMEERDPPNTLYFDRVSPGSLRLAQWARDCGALIVFEPSSIGDERQFQRAIGLCHVLKYSDESLGHVADLGDVELPVLVVETRGAEGLRFRWRRRWRELEGFHSRKFRDAAGSGDWCSAGLIHMLGIGGKKGIAENSRVDVVEALRFGQALAAVNCCFEGARGAMAALTREDMNRALGVLWESRETEHFMEDDSIEYGRRLTRKFCSTCERMEGMIEGGRRGK